MGPNDFNPAKASETFEPFQIDTELLGLKYELIEWLSERGYEWFTDFTDVEIDMGNAEILVHTRGDSMPLAQECAKWCIANGFTKCYPIEDHSYIKIKR
jgi:hypothetical protein